MVTYTQSSLRCFVQNSICIFIAFGLNSIGSAQVLRTFTEPYERIEVSAAELGIVESVNVRVGEVVKKDQLLGQLNSGILIESQRLARRRAESTARVDAAQADLRLKKSTYAKLEPLLRSGHANPSELERSKTEYEQAEAAVRLAGDEQAEAAIELARIEAQLRQRQIRSPMEGIVVDLHRKPGEFLPANDPRFGTVVDVSRLRSRFFVSTKTASKLSRGMKVTLLIGSQQSRASALVEFVSPITDSESGTVRIDVVIDNRTQRWRSGIACVLDVESDKLAEPSDLNIATIGRDDRSPAIPTAASDTRTTNRGN